METVKTYLDKLAVAADQKSSEEKYWLTKFSGDFTKSSFPGDYKEGGLVRAKPDVVQFQFTGKTFSRLMELINESDVRLFIFLISVLVVLLNKYTADKDITMGTPIYKQKIEAEFVNTVLPLKNRVENHLSFKGLLLQVGKVLFEAVENQNYPIETLLYHLNIPFSQEDDFPLFDITILLENIHDKKYIQHVRNNITFSFLRTEEDVKGKVEYNSLRYEKVTIERIVSHFLNLTRQVLQNIDMKVLDIDILSEKEKTQVLFDYNNTAAKIPVETTIHKLFEKQVEKTPENIAVMHQDHNMTYRELNEKANRLARVLKKRGVSANTLVGIMMENSLDTVVGILAVLKAGGAYLPIDQNLPERRISKVLDDGKIPIILTKLHDVEKNSSRPLQNLQSPGKGLTVTGVRQQITDLDNLPIPDRSLINYEKYDPYIGQAMAKHCIALQATRGCPYNCAFCHKLWPKKHIVRSADHIFAEVKLYYDLGVRRFVFVDDIFNLNRQNSTRFFQMVIENGLEVELFFPNGMRGDTLSKEYIDLMVRAGTVGLALALETASPRLQKLIQKNLQLEKLRENIEYFCQKYPNVILELFTMHGFPTETEEEALMTLDFIKSIKWLHFPYINILKIYPNTDMERIALENGVSRADILKSDNLAHHDVQDFLPFDKSFTKKYQADFLYEYFLSKERLLHVLPYQMKIFSEDEIVQKYNSYLPTEINNFAELLEFVGISKVELAVQDFTPRSHMEVRDLEKKIKEKFPAQPLAEGAYRILLLDLSQFFTHESRMLYEILEPPLGLMYILTYLNRQFASKIGGKIAKSRIDFDNYEELKMLIEEFKPDLIGIRTLNYYKNFFHKTVTVIRQWGIDVPIISGGPYATSGYKTLLQDGNVDLVVLGEGEETIAELVGKIMENGKKFPGEEQLKEIKGIAYVPGKTHWQERSPRQIIMLDTIDDLLSETPGENVEHTSGAHDTAYIILTSGSTGQPKGVMIEHRGLVNYISWAAQNYVRNERVNFPLCTSTAFDLTVTSIFTPLVTGNAIVIYSGDEREFLLKKVIEENRVDIVKLTPSHLKLIRDMMANKSNFFQQGGIASIKRLIVGGENLDTQLATDIHQLFQKNIDIYNEYGPTETVVGSMIYKFDPKNDNGESVPIGVPIDNTQIYLLDESKKPVPIGVAGEIYISGLGVARGYLNQPGMTAEKFVDNPFVTGTKMYATGDLARWFLNGNIEFLGRKDQQVKIRGFRVELGEIENKIRDFNRNGKSKVSPDGQGLQPLESKEVIRCTKCLLPDNYQGIQFNGEGVCHVCLEYETKYKAHLDTYFKEPDDFYRLAENLKQRKPDLSEYDCLLLFSGGKDSSYVLYQLIDMGLKVLGCTFDNGYISEAAFKNIERITSTLNVDHIVAKVESMNQVFVESLKSNHNVCHGCWHALNTMAVKIAHEKGINVVISGLSRGQIFDMRLEGLFQAGIFDEQEIEEKLLSFRKMFHSKDNKFFQLSRVDLEEKALENIQFIDFFRYFATPVHQIREYLSQKGWVQPQDTGFCSSNCLINDVGIYMFLKEQGYHFYAAPLSWDIRLGQLARDAGLKEMVFEGNLQHVGNILEEIGYYNASNVKDAVVVDKEDENGNKLLCAYIVPEAEISLSEPELREYLSRELPDYMIPTYFVQVDDIPLTASGKVDKKALLETEGTNLQISVTYVEPQDEQEKLIADLCKEVFKLDKIGIHDNFFNRGATSFSIIQLNSKLQEAFKRDIPVLTMFEYPTIASFLKYLAQEGPGEALDSKEEEEWLVSRKEGQDKLRRLRNRRMKGDN